MTILLLRGGHEPKESEPKTAASQLASPCQQPPCEQPTVLLLRFMRELLNLIRAMQDQKEVLGRC